MHAKDESCIIDKTIFVDSANRCSWLLTFPTERTNASSTASATQIRHMPPLPDNEMYGVSIGHFLLGLFFQSILLSCCLWHPPFVAVLANSFRRTKKPKAKQTGARCLSICNVISFSAVRTPASTKAAIALTKSVAQATATSWTDAISHAQRT